MDGMPATFKLRDLGVLRARDMPAVEVILVEEPEPEGPLGAKGVGEIPLSSPAPSAAAAVHHATGLLISDLPVLPEKIEKAHHERAEKDA